MVFLAVTAAIKERAVMCLRTEREGGSIQIKQWERSVCSDFWG
jgi:helix-turn-helix protein